jgi:hypothetical protein
VKKPTLLFIGILGLVGITLAQQTAMFTGVNEVKNANISLRMLQCYRETKIAPSVICNLQFTNLSGNTPLQLNLETKNVSALATIKNVNTAFQAQSLMLASQRVNKQTVTKAIDPFASEAISATFAIPNTVAKLNAVRIGEFQLTNIVISEGKPKQDLGAITVLDSSLLDFMLDGFKFTFKSFSASSNTVFMVYEGENTNEKEASVNTEGLTARVFDSTAKTWQSTGLSNSVSQTNIIKTPTGIRFQFYIQIGQTYGSAQLIQDIATKPAQYLELNIRGEQRIFNRIDLRHLVK